MSLTQDMKTKKINRIVRLIILAFILLLTTAIGFAHLHLRQKAPLSIDALCPFGAIESAYTLIYTGTMLKRIAASSFILFFAVLVTAILFGRSFCGLICPLGTLQELPAYLGKKIFGRQLKVPELVDRPARYLKYIVLLLVVVFSAVSGELVLRPYDPWLTYHHLTSTDLFSDYLIGFIVLILTVAGSLFFNRVFCKYLCPMGAFLALFGKLSWFGINRKEETCLHCQACNKACPVQIDVAGSSRINNLECISCNECVNVCPSGDTLYIGRRNSVSGLHNRLVLQTVVAIFAVIIGVTTLTGNFQWKNPSLQEEVTAAGKFDPSLIKGRMTLQEVADVADIPLQVFVNRFKVENADLNIPIKDMKGKYSFETDDVRVFVQEYLARQNTNSP